MKKHLIQLALIIIATTSVYSQPYENSVGIRAGYSSGICFKHFLNRSFAIDGMVLYNQHGFQFSGIYEYQFSPYAKERLHYYFGFGPHAGNWGEEFAIGAALLAGGEFIFRKAPVILGLEWKPMVNFYKQFDFGIPDLALTFKVVIN